MTWEDVKKKVNEKNKLRFPPLNVSQLPEETIPQYIRRVNTEINTSYLDKELTGFLIIVLRMKRFERMSCRKAKTWNIWKWQSI